MARKIYFHLHCILPDYCRSCTYLCLKDIANSKEFIIMAKITTLKKKEKNNRKIEKVSLAFQTEWGLKKLFGVIDPFVMDMVQVELECIQELDLTQDLLLIKLLVQEVRSQLGYEPAVDYGDFCDSIVALGLKIADISNTSLITSPAAWQDKVKNKILTIYYPDNVRNKVIEYLKARGFNVSTYLGKPIVKFNQLYVKVERLNNVI